MIEETENQEQSLEELIERVEQDDLPTNEFTIEDTDPMVLLGKINEVIGYLRTLQATIETSDTKATQALESAITALETANSTIEASATALSRANTALSTANSAISSANNAVETANNASTTANNAETKATEAKQTAEGIAGTANQALSTAQSANATANSANTTAGNANTTAQQALTTAQGKQDALTQSQQDAVNSGITSALVGQINTNTSDIAGKQAQLSQTQLDAVNSGITSTKVEEYDELVQYVENELDNKVDKSTTASQVYGTDSNGNQTSLKYNKSAEGSSIVQRKNDGQITVPTTPSADTDATSKSYVDGLLPTQFTNATANSTYVKRGSCQYIRIGKIVIVYINAVQFKNVRQENGAVIFSNLPTCAIGNEINLTSWGNSITARYTMAEGTGNMTNYWSAFTPTESPEQVFSGMFMYRTN